MHHHPFGKGTGAHRLLQRSGRIGDRPLAVEREDLLAHHLATLIAVVAVAAIADQRYHHVIARLDGCHPAPGPLDDTRCFMAVDRRQRPAPRTISKRDVGMTDRAGLDVDLYLARPRRCQLHLLDAQRLTERPAHRCFHETVPPRTHVITSANPIPRARRCNRKKRQTLRTPRHGCPAVSRHAVAHYFALATNLPYGSA